MRHAVVILICLVTLMGCNRQPPEYVSKYTAPPPTSEVDESTVQIAIVGDSLTAGSAQGGVGPDSWPMVAKSLLAAQGVEITPDVAAEGGSGYVQRGTGGHVFADLAPEALTPSDEIIVLFGSTNDADVRPSSLLPAVRSTLITASGLSPMAKLLVIGPPWFDANPSAEILEVRDAIRAEAVALGAFWVDPIEEGWFATRPDLVGSDGIHPTNAGHIHLAEKIAPLISQLLAQPPRP